MLLPESDHEREPPLPQNLSTILLGFAERLDRKCIQWSELDQLLGDRSFGFLLLLFALPNSIPFGNFFPGFAVVILALGLMEKDGVFIAAGLAMTIISVIALGGLVWTIFTGALVFLQQLAA